jgi:light-regulated signal transduction histidine kinase (bacteriophytochrome)
MMFSQYLQQATGCQLTDEAYDYIARMHNATERMQDLITDLLDLSRVNRKGLPFKQTSLNQVISSVLSDLNFIIEETQGTVNVGSLPDIEADNRQMSQLFLNLIGNALKFHRKDVPPCISVSSQVLNPSTCEIRIQDNGIGFDEKYVERIFGVFERLHGRSEYPGTGIGLAICQKIVARHGGSITASSKPGEGSIFVVTLPLKQDMN